VVAEFISSATKRRATGSLLTAAAAVSWVAEWMANTEWLDLVRATSEATLAAVHGYQMDVYDAQMWAVARVYGIPLIITEDMQFAPVIEEVRYVNPFAPTFDLADIGL
jgi:predicted nucleic acid-binding protein